MVALARSCLCSITTPRKCTVFKDAKDAHTSQTNLTSGGGLWGMPSHSHMGWHPVVVCGSCEAPYFGQKITHEITNMSCLFPVTDRVRITESIYQQMKRCLILTGDSTGFGARDKETTEM